MTETSDAGEILKKHHGEVPAETRRELEADDLHERLAAACEQVGIATHEIHAYSMGLGACLRCFRYGSDKQPCLPRSPADLLAELEDYLLRMGWIQTITRHRERCVVDWNTPFDQACAVGPSEKEAREKAAVAAVDKLKGKGV